MLNHMFIFHNFEDLHHILGERNVRFCETDEEVARAFLDADCALARADFHLRSIPTSHLVEQYTKRAHLEKPGQGGNDWVFVNAWMAPLSRAEAVKRLYGTTIQ